MPKNAGITNKVPPMYQGVLFPQGESNLSLNAAMNGVEIPSVSYPASTAEATVVSSSLTTSLRYQVK